MSAVSRAELLAYEWIESGWLERLGASLALGELLDLVRAQWGDFELVEHHTQGEFHHDIVLRLGSRESTAFLVVSTNCNGGIKEVLCASERPSIQGLWRWRCPTNPEFAGPPPQLVGVTRTVHWFDPCELLGDGARSELRPEFRERQPGGGFRRCAEPRQ